MDTRKETRIFTSLCINAFSTRTLCWRFGRPRTSFLSKYFALL